MQKFDSSVHKLVFVVLLVLYRLALDLCYYFAIVPNYGYMGFESDIVFSSYLVSLLIYVMVLPSLSLTITRLSDFYLLFFVLSFIAPLSSFYGLSGSPLYPLFLSVIVFLIFYVLTRRSVYQIFPAFPVLIEGKIISVFGSFVLVAFLIFWYFYSGATKYLNLDISKVYEFREDSAELANIGFLAYLNSWIYQVINLFLISVCLLKKRYFVFLILLLVQIFFFAVTGHKSLLFYPFLIFGVFYYFSGRSGTPMIVFLLLSLVVLSALIFFVFDNIWPVSLLVRRVLFIPSTLTYDYFSFFSANEMLYWSNSIFSSFFEYPYDKSLPKLIGEFNGTDSGANNGFISSGYAHAGFFGVIFYTFIFSFAVLALEKFSSKLPLWFAIALTVVPLRTAIISSDLFTVLLTHGLLLTLVLVFLYRPSSVNRAKVGAERRL
ncbi:MAG: hypothetical protein RIK85_02165 [Marinobacter sp.]